jgi:homogentisate phytyltransferase/homogentisate geranylgeranyltransferase
VWALTALTLPFSFAIAVLKDVPDVEGDRRFAIATFSVRLGARPVSRSRRRRAASARARHGRRRRALLDDATRRCSRGHLRGRAVLLWLGGGSTSRPPGDRRASTSASGCLFFAEYAVVAAPPDRS